MCCRDEGTCKPDVTMYDRHAPGREVTVDLSPLSGGETGEVVVRATSGSGDKHRGELLRIV